MRSLKIQTLYRNYNETRYLLSEFIYCKNHLLTECDFVHHNIVGNFSFKIFAIQSASGTSTVHPPFAKSSFVTLT